jgi:tRNA (mo5U34)-methyltransferase
VTRQERQALADALPGWWHSIELGEGAVSRGRKTPADHATELRALRLPDVRGRTVLDVGAWDGFYSFWAEEQGAARVVALDWNSWVLEDAGGPGPHVADADGLPGRRRFDLARRMRGSRVEAVAADFTRLEPSSLGTFDVVLFFGVLYHLRDPLGALRRVRSLTAGLAVIETHAVVVPGFESLPLWQLYPGDELCGDPTNWWGPTERGLVDACGAAGFASAEVVDVRDRGAERTRIVVHARA